MSWEERIQPLGRDYGQMEVERLMEAAAEVFRRMDPQVELEQSDGKLVARIDRSGLLGWSSRDWYQWVVMARQYGDQTQVSVHLEVVNRHLLSSSVSSYQGTAAYVMFFMRLENLLGLRQRWPECRELRRMRRRGQVLGALDPVCKLSRRGAKEPEWNLPRSTGTG